MCISADYDLPLCCNRIDLKAVCGVGEFCSHVAGSWNPLLQRCLGNEIWVH